MKKDPVVPLGVYTNYESDHAGQYQVIAGIAVDRAAPTPEGLVRVSLPAAPYLVFEGEGDMPGVVIETWKAVWRHFADPSARARAYMTDFEVYRGPKAVEIYVSVK